MVTLVKHQLPVGLDIMLLSVMIVVPVEELKLMIVQEQVDGVMLPM